MSTELGTVLDCRGPILHEGGTLTPGLFFSLPFNTTAPKTQRSISGVSAASEHQNQRQWPETGVNTMAYNCDQPPGPASPGG